jgi:hypothetical protein
MLMNNSGRKVLPVPVRLITFYRILLRVHIGTSKLKDVTFQNGSSKNLLCSVMVYSTSLSVLQLRIASNSRPTRE